MYQQSAPTLRSFQCDVSQETLPLLLRSSQCKYARTFTAIPEWDRLLEDPMFAGNLAFSCGSLDVRCHRLADAPTTNASTKQAVLTCISLSNEWNWAIVFSSGAVCRQRTVGDRTGTGFGPLLQKANAVSNIEGIYYPSCVITYYVHGAQRRCTIFLPTSQHLLFEQTAARVVTVDLEQWENLQRQIRGQKLHIERHNGFYIV